MPISKGPILGQPGQGSRLIKVQCFACGCVLRLTRGWLVKYQGKALTCFCGAPMQVAEPERADSLVYPVYAEVGLSKRPEGRRLKRPAESPPKPEGQ